MSRTRAILAATLVGFLAGVTTATAAGWGTTSTTTGRLTAAVEFPPVVDLIPTIIGIATDGQTLKLDPGSFSPPATSYTTEWLRCDAAGANCVAIGTAVSQLLAAADITNTIRVRVTPKNGAMPGTPVVSEASSPAKASLTGPLLNMTVANPLPAITGTATVGTVLTATDGSWISLLGIGTRQWVRCDAIGANCVAIPGATNSTYTLVAADRGSRLRVRVTGTGVIGLGGSNTAASLATAKVA